MARCNERREDRVQRLFQILERAANADAPCPANAELASLLGYKTPSNISGMLNLMAVAGLIEVSGNSHGHVVTICRTGKRTAGLVKLRTPGGWTEDEDAMLMDAIADGNGFSIVAKGLGKTRFAAMSRFRKLANQMGAQAI
jgi:transcriptional regulator of acetoin/glycerol metabolism